MRSSNPVFNIDKIKRVGHNKGSMTVEGTVNKTGMLLCILCISGFFAWQKALFEPSFSALLLPGAIIGFLLAILNVFKPEYSLISAPIYALVEGVVLGIFSAFMESQYPGIAFQAVSITMAIFAAVLILYKAKVLRATEQFRSMIMSATLGICLLYCLSMVLSLFGVRMPMIHDASPIGILFSLFVVGIAAMNLVLDFDFVERGARAQLPSYMEWYAGFGLLVTVVWLYIEVLKLLSKLNRRS